VRRSRPATAQDKAREIDFFDRHAVAAEYDAFAAGTTAEIVDRFVGFVMPRAGDPVLDLGCGSGAFAAELQRRGLSVVGLDLSRRLLRRGRATSPGVRFVAGDAEQLPFRAGTFAGVLLSGVVHHLPNPERLARETHRVLRPGGRFLAFDPNRRNPAMWLYRDWGSPFYSDLGVTANERPVLADDVQRVFSGAGFQVFADYLTAQYRYVASGRVRWLLPAWYRIESVLLAPRPLRQLRALVLTLGIRDEGLQGAGQTTVDRVSRLPRIARSSRSSCRAYPMT
jgi:SAM-dependent methyltransferase